MQTVTTPLIASFDIEADGNNPLQHSMLSLGIAFFRSPEILVETFYVNIEPQIGKVAEAKCMEEFWSKHPKQLEMVQSNRVTPETAMLQLHKVLEKLSTRYKISWVAGPSCFDWMFVKCYYEFYGPVNKTPLGFYCQDLTSFARAYAIMHNMNLNQLMIWLVGKRDPETIHHALEDAKYQGLCYMKIRQKLNMYD